jgi:hypothetical protein
MIRALTFRLRCRVLGLSALLTLSLLATLPGCGSAPDSKSEVKKRNEVLNSLQEQQAKITTKNYAPYGNGYVVDLSGARLTDETFAKLKELQRVTELDLSKSSITDAQMDKVNEIALVLLRLDLSNTAVTDAGLAKLTKLNRCLNLKLAGTKVTKEAVERFKEQHAKRPNTRGVPLPPMEVEME